MPECHMKKSEHWSPCQQSESPILDADTSLVQCRLWNLGLVLQLNNGRRKTIGKTSVYVTIYPGTEPKFQASPIIWKVALFEHDVIQRLPSAVIT